MAMCTGLVPVAAAATRCCAPQTRAPNSEVVLNAVQALPAATRCTCGWIDQEADVWTPLRRRWSPRVLLANSAVACNAGV